MRQSKKSREREKLLLAAMHAEDDAVMCLSRLDPGVALATARSVEKTLAIRWEAEQKRMIQRDDPREIIPITETHIQNLNFAVAKVPRGVHRDAIAEKQVLHLLGDLPSDQAWWVAHKVARYQQAKFERSQRPSTTPPDPARLVAELAKSFYQSAEL
jgi:hypothetical protein